MKLNWDDPVPEELKQNWRNWLDEMQLLTSRRIPRCLKPDVAVNDFSTEFHLFTDASEVAYSAACYIKLKYVDGSVRITSLFGKSRLALIKSVTIPRLELCAAVLAKMYESISSKQEYDVTRSTFGAIL